MKRLANETTVTTQEFSQTTDITSTWSAIQHSAQTIAISPSHRLTVHPVSYTPIRSYVAKAHNFAFCLTLVVATAFELLP